jgi:hypothetical protein
MDEQAIAGSVERMLRMGAKAHLMELLDHIIRENRLDRFVGRLGND